MKNVRTSAEFQTQATKAALSIALFIFTYLLLLALAVGLMGFCVYLGIALFVVRPSLYTIALGLALVSLGLLVLFFLLKFVFQSNKVDRSHLTEIKRSDEPALFQMIDEIVLEVGTHFPKKVYLSYDVNAAVFYDSSFWSMFFPVKKNLLIGLGLVNTVTQSELKAILSHEFGHFSQKSMKLGSYVYNVNRIIFNLLFENESYENLVYRWARANGYFALVVVVASRIIEGIQWVLRQIYGVVNKSYLALSREMEFHADEIAAHVTGYEPIKSSLLRMSLTDHSYNAVLSFYERKIDENKRSENIYSDHTYVTGFFARINRLDIVNNLPQVTEGTLTKYNKSKLVIKDQWASHPSTEDRIAMVEKTGLSSSNLNNEAANLLFTDIEKTQRKITEKIFANVTYTGPDTRLTPLLFQTEFQAEFKKNTFSSIYNSYYDNKHPLHFDTNGIEPGQDDLNLSDLFSDSKVDEVYTLAALESDFESLKNIADNTYRVKTFDYDGIKYEKKDANVLMVEIEKEITALKQVILANDIAIFRYFKSLEEKAKQPALLEELYTAFFKFSGEFEAKYDVYIQLSNGLSFINETTPFEEIKAKLFHMEEHEEVLKERIAEILGDELYRSELTPAIKDNLELYLSRKWQYFDGENYDNENLEILFHAMHNFAYLFAKAYFLVKQKLLNYQEGLIQPSHRSVHAYAEV